MSAASAPISDSTWVFRVAAALASNVPQSCSSFRTVLRLIDPRLSLRSLAGSGGASFRLSTLIRSSDQADALSSSPASSVRSPLRQLHAPNSSDCRASSTRSTSSTLRPTEPAVTETNWISLLGSTMFVTRSATPSLLSAPVAATGALNNEGVADRVTYIVDPNNEIQFVSVTAGSVGRNVDEVLRVLDALQSDELCACNWRKGDPTLDAGELLKASA